MVDDRLPAFRAGFVRRFYDTTTRLFRDSSVSQHSSLHANVLPLLFGLAPDEAVPSIVNLIRNKELNCGVYMAYFVLKSLAKVNEHELLYTLMRNEGPHSWVNMVREGATTCFEAWGKDQKWNTSLCHPWASAPIPLLIEDVFGLKPGKPGWGELRFEPHFPTELQFATLRLKLPDGLVTVQYHAGKEPTIRFASTHTNDMAVG